MTNSRLPGYLCNCFWLLLPILAFNLIFMRQLPPAYQMGVFWKDIPKAIGVPENLLRTLVMIFPVFMRLRISTPGQKLGLGLYVTGLLVYIGSWAALIAAPESAWSTSAIGFLAPAYTPIVWLIGIGLIGDELQLPRIQFKPWMYWTVSAFFLLFHNLHAFTVYSRGI
ncbi:MAG: hypothetical protein ABR912_12680 [Terracidiphilus sp.]|jgi:hypothetical protein